jgi:hypothetical protein
LAARSDKTGSRFVVFAAFLGLASDGACRIHGNVWSGDTSGLHLEEMVCGAEPDRSDGNEPGVADMELAFVCVRPARGLRILYIGGLSEGVAVDSHPRRPSYRLLFGVMAYSFYDHFRPEPNVRGGLSIAMLLAAHFLMIGSAAVVIVLVARRSGGSGVRDGVHG